MRPPEAPCRGVELPVAEQLHAPLRAHHERSRRGPVAGGVAGGALLPLRRDHGRRRGRGGGALGELVRVEAAGDLAGDVAVVGEGGDEGEERERGEGDDDDEDHRLLALVLVAAAARHWSRGSPEP